MSKRRAYQHCPMCGASLTQRERNGELRPVCPMCDYTVYYDPKVAVVMLLLQDERVLLIKRAVDPQKGMWALPAGFVNAGENPQDAAVREVLEETNLIAKHPRLLDVFHNPGDGSADIIIAYQLECVGGELLAGDDALEAQWFLAHELPPTAFLTTHWLLERWQKHTLY